MKESHLEVGACPLAREQQNETCTGSHERQSGVDCLSRALLATAEPRTSLGTAVNDVCAGLALRDTFRVLFEAELRDCRVGWPRLVSAGPKETAPPGAWQRPAPWLRDGDVMVELARSVPEEPFELGVVFPAATAIHLSDRLLGAPVSSGMASVVGAPSDAECGVLAYAAARLAAAHARGWIVRDVGKPVVPSARELVVWPVVIDTSVGKLELTLCLSASLASALPAIELHTLLHETVRHDGVLAFAPGEVWVSDQLPLTRTSLGLTGPVTLRVPDCEQLVAARLTEHYLQCTPDHARPSPSEHAVELLLASRALDFLALASFRSGARCFIGEVGREPISIRQRGQTMARGELVVWRGALGVRITEA